jgi:hypothetical protein
MYIEVSENSFVQHTLCIYISEKIIYASVFESISDTLKVLIFFFLQSGCENCPI